MPPQLWRKCDLDTFVIVIFVQLLLCRVTLEQGEVLQDVQDFEAVARNIVVAVHRQLIVDDRVLAARTDVVVDPDHEKLQNVLNSFQKWEIINNYQGLSIISSFVKFCTLV